VVLSDRTIRRLLDEGRIVIDPFDDRLVQPSSVDVRVDRFFRVFHNARYPFIDVKEPQEELTELVEVDDDTPFILHPGEFVLGSTLERIRLPDDLVARLDHGMKIGQLSFVQMTEPAETPYGADALGSKYQGQRGPTPSRYWKNFERERV
jgi:dCTP deaminase